MRVGVGVGPSVAVGSGAVGAEVAVAVGVGVAVGAAEAVGDGVGVGVKVGVGVGRVPLVKTTWMTVAESGVIWIEAGDCSVAVMSYSPASMPLASTTADKSSNDRFRSDSIGPLR